MIKMYIIWMSSSVLQSKLKSYLFRQVTRTSKFICIFFITNCLSNVLKRCLFIDVLRERMNGFSYFTIKW